MNVKRLYKCGMTIGQRLDKDNKERKIPRCKACGFRVRGANHENGPHHNGQTK